MPILMPLWYHINATWMMRTSQISVFMLCLSQISFAQEDQLRRPICPRLRISAPTQNITLLQSYDPVTSFTEVSGIALSPTQNAPNSNSPVLFVVNDRGGGGERLGIFDSGTGERIMTLQIPSNFITNKDWESMAIGSCGSTGVNETCIYIADIGDNASRDSNGRQSNRDSSTPYRILKIREPLLADFKDNDVIPISYLSLLSFDYLHRSSPTDFADSEAMFMDHTGWGARNRIGDLYLVTKWNPNERNNNRLFKIPASSWPAVMDGSSAGPHSIKAVGRYGDDWNGGELQKKTWTGADATYDGTLIALGTTGGNFLFLRCPGATVAEALTRSSTSCLRWDAPPGKVESISWTADGMRIINIPEGNNKVMSWTTMLYDQNASTQSCPQVEWEEARIKSGKRRYCRSRDDGSRRPRAWCRVQYSSERVEGTDLFQDAHSNALSLEHKLGQGDLISWKHNLMNRHHDNDDINHQQQDRPL